jgi:putative endonuclease
VSLAPFGPVCFVEVKARERVRAAAESVAPPQQARIARAASLYLAARPALARRGARFDVVAIAPGGWPRHFADVWRAEDL